ALDVIKNYNSKIPTKLMYDYFYLGADFAFCAKVHGEVRDTLSGVFSGLPVYLIVGTIEPRKNHSYVIDAFENLWNQGSRIRLCIVGRVGWMCDDIVKRINASTYLSERLFWFSDLNDDELEYCYEHGKALVMASRFEGFGLPLVEAMHYGKPVFASDIPVFREIGEDYPIYFDLADSNSLANKIHEYENNVLDQEFNPRNWLSWDESIEDLFAKVIAIAQNEN
ncbi:MAG: glycosyltransferase family 1 protein, partial [Deltaproteobacteria bacterium]|nr:glycosyltransferase family 1 protein [Deltaproteobacteria bacterium]